MTREEMQAEIIRLRKQVEDLTEALVNVAQVPAYPVVVPYTPPIHPYKPWVQPFQPYWSTNHNQQQQSDKRRCAVSQ